MKPFELAQKDREISVPFYCELHIDSVKAMQAAGRTVFGLYRPNPDPNSPDIRRPWDGDTVYDLRLMYNGKQVHRVMSDSVTDAERLMQEAIQNLVFAAYRQSKNAEFDAIQYQKLVNERREIAQFVEFNYRDEIQRGAHARFGDSLSSAIFHYLSIERNRWSVKLGRLLRRKR